MELKRNRFWFKLSRSLVLLLFFTLVFGACQNNRRQGENIDIEIIQSDLDIVYGTDGAPLRLIMYSNYSCSFCRKFYSDVYPQLKTNFIDQGKVQLVVKLIELSNDSNVINGQKTAVCINKYGNFEKLHQLLLIEPNVVYSKEFGAVIDEFIEKDDLLAECLLSGEAEVYLTNNIKEFKKIGFTGTPSFVINSRALKGYHSYTELEEMIRKEIDNNLE